MNVSYNLFCVYIYLKSLCGSHFPECLSWRVGRPLIGRSTVRYPAPPVHMSKWPRASYWTPNCSRRHSHRCMGVCEWVRLDPDEQDGTLHGSLRHQCMNVWVNGVNDMYCKALWVVGRLEERYIIASPFTKSNSSTKLLHFSHGMHVFKVKLAWHWKSTVKRFPSFITNLITQTTWIYVQIYICDNS